MSFDRLEGNWRQVKGNLKEILGKLIGSQPMIASGKREQVVGRIQEDYGVAIIRAEEQLSELLSQWQNLRH